MSNPKPAPAAAPNGESIVHVRADSDSMLEEMFAVVQQKNPPAQGCQMELSRTFTPRLPDGKI